MNCILEFSFQNEPLIDIHYNFIRCIFQSFLDVYSKVLSTLYVIYQDRCTNIYRSHIMKWDVSFECIHWGRCGSNEKSIYNIFSIFLFVSHKFFQMINIRPINFTSVYTLYRQWICVWRESYSSTKRAN